MPRLQREPPRFCGAITVRHSLVTTGLFVGSLRMKVFHQSGEVSRGSSTMKLARCECRCACEERTRGEINIPGRGEGRGGDTYVHAGEKIEEDMLSCTVCITECTFETAQEQIV